MTQTLKRLGTNAVTLGVLSATSLTVAHAADKVAANTTCSGTGTIADGANCAAPTGAATNLFATGGLFSTISNTLIFIVGAVSVIMLIIGGLRYVLSGGESSAVKGAKDTILYAIIGIIVAIVAFAAVSFVIGRLTPTS